MDAATFLLEAVLHVDRHLGVFVHDHGAWVYALLFAVVFVETGLVVMPFLPGDSLLFVAGTLSGVGAMSWPVAAGVLLAAAIAGDQVNYTVGRALGPKVFRWEHSRWFDRRAFDAAHRFYERHGGTTVVLARFMPLIRTFAPFVAGVAAMGRARFTAYNVAGALVWVLGLTAAGHAFGQRPFVQQHLSQLIWALVLVPGLIAAIGGCKARHVARVIDGEGDAGTAAR